MKNTIIDMLKGMVIGVSNILPGVSGGTMAVLLGIYERLIDAINNIKSDFKSSVFYLGKIAMGALIGIVIFSGIIGYLLDNYLLATNCFLYGLVIVGVPFVNKEVESLKGYKKFLYILMGFVIVFAIGVFSRSNATSDEVELVLNVRTSVMLGIAGFITAVTMILPGISGSLTLVVLGLYDTLLAAVSSFNIPLLIPCAIGGIIGLVTTTKLVKYLLTRHNDITYSVIIGLMSASAFMMLIGIQVLENIVLSIIAMLCGQLVGLYINSMGKKGK